MGSLHHDLVGKGGPLADLVPPRVTARIAMASRQSPEKFYNTIQVTQKTNSLGESETLSP